MMYIVSAAPYGSGSYGSGVYGVGEEAAAAETPSTGGGGSSTTTVVSTATDSSLDKPGESKQFIIYKDATLTLSKVAGGHNVTVEDINITVKKITITVTSTPQTVQLSVKDSKKFDLRANGFYNLKITLDSIESSSSVKLTFEVLDGTEAVPKQSITTSYKNTTQGDANATITEVNVISSEEINLGNDSSDSVSFISLRGVISILLFILLIILIFIIINTKKRKHKKRKIDIKFLKRNYGKY